MLNDPLYFIYEEYHFNSGSGKIAISVQGQKLRVVERRGLETIDHILQRISPEEFYRENHKGDSR